jgi:H/ACA ribonucleoprotein complex subunit 3
MFYMIKKCPQCGVYTLRDVCPRCGSKTVSPHPARFNPQDKYVKYRVMARKKVSQLII